ncbi:hypothetical protein [Mucilaginibacter terrae]|uniref:Integral membrane protein n=1 Tax=Mucilaginibacter terrae TaxID=1955052 RepID=A0ABU3H297_9SPHI|nr:hypothetical protein [Mucilaginibacter terrae]MDT3405035.1 putative integral membrane protein [Mucilaginibacter terrae]
MSFKTIIALLLLIFITAVLLQNTDEAEFTILFIPMTVPKVAMLTSVSVSAFLLGVLVARPRRKARRDEDDDLDNDDYINDGDGRRTDTLSDEDREYIS